MANKDVEKLMPGMIKGAEIYGTVCSARDCENCAVGIVIGDDTTCAEFAKKFPKKFISLLMDEYNEGISYAEEFLSRFPYSDLNAEEMVNLGMCRKALFAGDISCTEQSDAKCLACWNERFISDVEDADEEYEAEDSGVSYEFAD